MNKLSKPMRDLITSSSKEYGLLTTHTGRTVTALKARGLVDESGRYLTKEGLAVRAELLGEEPTTVGPVLSDGVHARMARDTATGDAPMALWELELLGEVDPHPFEPNHFVTPEESAALIAEDEATRAPVPNRKERRAFDRLLARMNRTVAKDHGKTVKEHGRKCVHPLNRRRFPDLFRGFGRRKREICTGCDMLVVF